MLEEDKISVEEAKILMNKFRTKILKHLSERRYTASELARLLNLSVPTVHYHLSLLEKAGFVRKVRSNRKWKYYELTEAGKSILRKKSLRIIIFSTLVVIVFLTKLLLFKNRNIAPKPLGGTVTPVEIILFAILAASITAIVIYVAYKLVKE
ncbi:transcriptional regulator, ArsR family [Ferroglobus placidus DSM 10642]|uniref:Transcriptional regulator, ArsR family n=1 Tax=Ferroglobus placidus (strain DSM 10642 / AEDII12DO) TaxID=589924 RepID=D3RZA4_FERPA|nr:winged helix-turn-helix domain-containing protein [Ferroglobus placidus]ADC65817.1 transcriptional regulator, ArsR family [Ferroglobus placidus DSM 10642]